MTQTAYLTRSKATDLFLFLTIALGILLAGPRLLVYHSIVAAEIRGTRTGPDGSTSKLEPPAHLRRAGAAKIPLDTHLGWLEYQLSLYMEGRHILADEPSGTSVEWEIRYSVDSMRLDRTKKVVFKK